MNNTTNTAAKAATAQTAPRLDFETVKRAFETAHAADPHSDSTAAACWTCQPPLRIPF